MYKKIKGYYPEIIDHFPQTKKNSEYMPPKKYMGYIKHQRLNHSK